VHTRRVLTRLGAIANAMTTLPEPKAIILISGGFISDIGVRGDMADLASITERTRVTVHSLLVEAEASAGTGNNTDTRRLDSNAGMGGTVGRRRGGTRLRAARDHVRHGGSHPHRS
jgi:hypothetical protein